MSPEKPVIGIVLTGGQSTRMGNDKTMINYHGFPQYQHIFHLLSGYCFKTYLSVKDYSYPLIFPQLKDNFSFGGPINGILTALSAFPDFTVLILACDMPAVSKKMIEKLITSYDHKFLATCFSNNNEPEPLLSLWSCNSYPLLLKQAQAGNYSPAYFLKNNYSQLVTPDNKNLLININTPEEKQNFQLS